MVFLIHTELRCTVNHTSDLLPSYIVKTLKIFRYSERYPYFMKQTFFTNRRHRCCGPRRTTKPAKLPSWALCTVTNTHTPRPVKLPTWKFWRQKTNTLNSYSCTILHILDSDSVPTHTTILTEQGCTTNNICPCIMLTEKKKRSHIYSNLTVHTHTQRHFLPVFVNTALCICCTVCFLSHYSTITG